MMELRRYQYNRKPYKLVIIICLALIMAGDSDGPDGAGEDWNAIQDIDAYRYVTEKMTDLVQMTRPDCETEFEENGYPFEAVFLEEYIDHMKSMDENVCCYDLQAVSLYFSKKQ